MFSLALYLFLGIASTKPAKVQVPTTAPDQQAGTPFHDAKYGVRFVVPAGWEMSKKDHEVSSFRLDAPKTTGRNEMRSVLSMTFNPFPLSTLSGASIYYSVERHATDAECEQQATLSEKKQARRDVVNIGGVNFLHDHRESGTVCLESRDDVYVAYRKGACYRFDVAMNFFCSQTSGAQDITLEQMKSLESRAADVFSTISFDWDKTGATKVSPPEIEPDEAFTPVVKKPVPSSSL